jgi:hypothetical protein
MFGRWYRKLRGGRWAQVTGFFFGKRWVKVPDECIQIADYEDYRTTSYDNDNHGV